MAELDDIFLTQMRRLLPARKNRLLVATSGGPDSQCLLHLLATHQAALDIEALWAVGIDHSLRSAAASELQCAKDLATSLSIPYLQHTLQLPPTGNRLAQARTARYRALHALAKQLGADFIATGHHATDQAETFLFQALRGAPPTLLAAMRSKRGRLLRPLLPVDGNTLRTYCITQRLIFATDPSNLHPARLRGYLRTSVFPPLQARFPKAAVSIARATTQLAEEADFLTAQARKLCQRLHAATPQSLRLHAIAHLPRVLRRRILSHWLATQGLSHLAGKLLDTLLNPDPPAYACWRLPQGTLCLHQQTLWRLPLPAFGPPRPLELTPNASPQRWPLTLGDRPARLEGQRLTTPNPNALMERFALRKKPCKSVAFDAGGCYLPLTLRCWQPGDALQPFGSLGRMKVGDLFTNLKVPRPLRAHWPVVVHGTELIWVVGLQRAHFAPLSDATRETLVLRLLGGLPWEV